MLIFREERFADVIGEARPMIERHWEESARNRSRVPLNMDHARYAALDDRRQLLILTARNAEKLVGYAVYFVLPFGTMHSVGTPWAQSDVYWVDPWWRRPRVALRLFRGVELALAARGVRIMQTHAICASVVRLLEFLGHAQVETVLAKAL